MRAGDDLRFEQGLEFYRQANFQAAIRVWKALLEEGFPHPNLGLYLWAAQSEYGRMLQAVEQLAEDLPGSTVSSAPDTIAQAHAALRRQQPERALELLREAIALTPDTVVSRLMAARAAVQCGRLAEALDFAKEAEALKPADPEILATLGQVLSEMGKAADAETAFLRSLELSDRLATAWYGLAAMRYRDRRLGDAESFLERALSCLEKETAGDSHALPGAWQGFQPPLQAARAFLDEVRLEKRRIEEQLEECARVLAEHPGYVDWQYRRGLLAATIGRAQEALEALDRALALNPRMVSAWRQKAQLLHSAGEHRGACEALRQASALAGAAADREAEAAYLAGKYEEAAGCWLRAIQLTPDYASRHIELGKRLHSEGLWDEATRALERGLSLAPQYADGHHALGLIALDRGMAGKAIGHFRAALGLNPNFAEAALKLVTAYFDDGNETAARDTLEQWKKRLESEPRLSVLFRDLEKRSSESPIKKAPRPKSRSPGAGRAKAKTQAPAQARSPRKPPARKASRRRAT